MVRLLPRYAVAPEWTLLMMHDRMRGAKRGTPLRRTRRAYFLPVQITRIALVEHTGPMALGKHTRDRHRLRASYIALWKSGELRGRTERAVAALADCKLCPRRCGVDRLRDNTSVCCTGRHAIVSSYGPHFGEERCLSGTCGSGTVFFAHCNLRCVFCQNYEISWGG